MTHFLKTLALVALICGTIGGISYEAAMTLKNTGHSFLWIGVPYVAAYAWFLRKQCVEAFHG